MLLPDRAKEPREHFGGTGAEAMHHIVFFHVQILSVTVAPAQRNMRVRIGRVIVMGRHPGERPSEVLLHLGHDERDIACPIQAGLIRHLDHDAKLMRVLLRRGDECRFVGGGRTKERRLLLVAALAMRQIGEMLARRGPVGNRGLDKGLLTASSQRADDRTDRPQGTETLGQPGPAGLGLLDIAPAEVNL